MYRRLLLGLILLFLVIYLITPRPEAPCWTASHPNESYRELVTAGLETVRDKFPEWYNAETSIGVDLSDEKNLAYAHPIDAEGTIGIKLTQKGLDLCTGIDMGALLLHEYVHVDRWDEIEAMYPTEPCNTVRHELEANWVVLESYDELKYDQKTGTNFLDLYRRYYIKGIIMCPFSIYEDFPPPQSITLWQF